MPEGGGFFAAEALVGASSIALYGWCMWVSVAVMGRCVCGLASYVGCVGGVTCEWEKWNLLDGE